MNNSCCWGVEYGVCVSRLLSNCSRRRGICITLSTLHPAGERRSGTAVDRPVSAVEVRRPSLFPVSAANDSPYQLIILQIIHLVAQTKPFLSLGISRGEHTYADSWLYLPACAWCSLSPERYVLSTRGGSCSWTDYFSWMTEQTLFQ